MADRKQKVEELLAGFRSFRRSATFRTPAFAAAPRVTPSQWGVLMFIEQRGRSTVKEVSRSLGITSSAATQLVDGLVTSGYLTREHSTEDRRSVVLALSKKSRDDVERMKQYAVRNFLEIFEVLNDREFDQYAALNKKLVERSLLKSRQ